MCLIIRCEQDKELKLRHFLNMYRRNDDGYGFMWIQDNAIHGLKRQGATVDELYNKYLELKQFNPVIHLRMRTHGKVNEENAHPYYCGFGIWLMHNGVLNHPSISNNHDMSDTWQFIEQTLNPIFKQSRNPHTLIRSQAFSHLMEGFIGRGNRVVLGDRGGYVYFNADTWYKVPDDVEDIGGLMVSNTYAWDVNEFKKKANQSYTSNHIYGYRNASGGSSYRSGSHWDTQKAEWSSPGSSNIGSTGASNFKHVARGYYKDPWEGVWLWNGYSYSRRRDLDDREDLKELIEKHEGMIPIQWDTFNVKGPADPDFTGENEDGMLTDESAMLCLPYCATPPLPRGELDNETSKETKAPEADKVSEEDASTGLGISEARDGGSEREAGEADDTQVEPHILDDADELIRLEILCRQWADLDMTELEQEFWSNNEEAIKAFYFLLQTMPLD